MRLRLIDVAEEVSPTAGAVLQGLELTCDGMASNPQDEVEEPERLPCQGDDNNQETTLRERYQQIAGDLVIVAFTVVLIFAGAAAATLGRRIVQWVLRATQGVRQAMFRFIQRVFVPLRRLASPALRRRIFGRNWSGWLRRRFGVGARDLLGRRQARIGNDVHELALIRRANGQVDVALCSVPPCGPLLGRLRNYRDRLFGRNAALRRRVDDLIDEIENLERISRENGDISGGLDAVRRGMDELPNNTEAQRRLLNELNEFLGASTTGRVTRPLTAADLGLPEGSLQVLDGTVTTRATRMSISISDIRGQIGSPFELMMNMRRLAERAGMQTLEIAGRNIRNDDVAAFLMRYPGATLVSNNPRTIIIPPISIGD